MASEPLATRTVDEALAALGSSDHPQAAGVACALAAAAAAALLELSSGLTADHLESDAGEARAAGRHREVSARAAELRERLLAAADDDVAAYEKVRDAAKGAERTAALRAASDPPLSIAEDAAEVAEQAQATADRAGDWAFGPDATVSALLAASAARAAAELVSANLGADSRDPRIGRAHAAAERASGAVRGASDAARE